MFSINQGQPKVQPVWHSGHHICLSAVSCNFLHQEILAFRCIGRLLGGGGPFGQKTPACRGTCRWRRRFRLDFPPLSLGILLVILVHFEQSGKGCVENKSFSWSGCYVCDDQPAIFSSCVIGITPNVLLRS